MIKENESDKTTPEQRNQAAIDMFKKEGLAAGTDVESILTRTQTYLEEGDLDQAAREMNGLKGWAKTLSRDWLGEVRKVLEVQQALEVRFPPYMLS